MYVHTMYKMHKNAQLGIDGGVKIQTRILHRYYNYEKAVRGFIFIFFLFNISFVPDKNR